jgi:RNA polymerase sigma-70 factor (ECF subfamily)
LQPYPDVLLVADQDPGPAARYHAKEAVELAFVAGLQHLPPRQAATLVLCDVLGYSTAEAADLLETGATVVKGLLQRARAQLRPALDPDRVSRPGSPREREVTRRFAEAFTAGDINGLLTLLTDDAWLAMPPAPHEYRGPAAIAEFLTTFGAWRGPHRRFRLLPTRANTHPAFGCYLTDPGEPFGHSAGILVLTVPDDRIRTVTWFLHDDLQRHFGLPAHVEI